MKSNVTLHIDKRTCVIVDDMGQNKIKETLK